MHRVDGRTYVGTPNELVTVTTQLGAGGQVKVEVDGQDIGAARQFPSPQRRVPSKDADHGGRAGRRDLRDREFDLWGVAAHGDFLMAQAHNPMPSNIYRFSIRGLDRDSIAGRRSSRREPPRAPPRRSAGGERAKAAKKKAKAAKTKKRGRQ